MNAELAAGVKRVVIVGAGQAGGQAAISLRSGGFEGLITLIGAEPEPPYQRPPLSKKYLDGSMSVDRLLLKPAEAYGADRVTLRLGVSAAGVDRHHKQVLLADGEHVPYDFLILATGSRVRKLTSPGADLDGIFYLRTKADSDLLRPRLKPGARMVVIGCGYIGLEVAAVARAQGLEVVALEAMDRVLQRVTSPLISEFYTNLHKSRGVDVRTGVGAAAFEGQGKLEAVLLNDGSRLPCDVAVVGVGILPEQELAQSAGIVCDNGVVVDRLCRTSDPSVYAIGDCAKRPLVHYGREQRLESVHNALEQAKITAATILGQTPPVEETPWFWSDQYDVKLQIAGISTGYDQLVVRGDPGANKFAAFYFDAGTLIAADCVNMPAEFLAAKILIARKAKVAPARLADTSVPMKDIAAAAN